MIARLGSATELLVMQYCCCHCYCYACMLLCHPLGLHLPSIQLAQTDTSCFAYAVRWPTRALQQEEEEQAVGSAEQHLQPPVIEVCATCAGCCCMTCTRGCLPDNNYSLAQLMSCSGSLVQSL